MPARGARAKGEKRVLGQLFAARERARVRRRRGEIAFSVAVPLDADRPIPPGEQEPLAPPSAPPAEDTLERLRRAKRRVQKRE